MNLQETGVRLSELGADEALHLSLELLEAELQRCALRDRLYELVAADLAAQVLEAGRAVRILSGSEASRLAYLPARNAFEAFHDLLELLEFESDPDSKAAELMARSIISHAASRGLLQHAAPSAADEVQNREPSLAEFMERFASQLNSRWPGAKERLLAAFKANRGKRASSERRGRIRDLKRNSEFASSASMFESYWDSLSLKSHPHFRINDGFKIRRDGVSLVLNPDRVDEGPAQAAAAAVYSCTVLCRKHLRPDLSEPQGGDGPHVT